MAKTVLMGSQQTEFDQLLERELQKRLGAQTQALDALEAAKRALAERQKTLMDTQLNFLMDPAKKKAGICTRQSGKTFISRHMAVKAVLENKWENRDSQQPVVQYIAQTRAKALDLFWTPFKEICRMIGLDAHWDDHSLRGQFPNGVLVRAGGAEDKDEIEKYRGDQYPLVIIDEAASFGPQIENLVMSALDAAMMRYNGTIAMIGTPGQAKAGMFWEIYSGFRPEWSVHKWSYMTNIYLPESVRSIDWITANIGPIDNPRVQREYFGNWVTDASSLVYQFDPARSAWDGVLPEGHEWRYLLGMDLGYRDPTAFVVGAYAKTHPNLYIVHAEAYEHLLPSQIAQKVDTLRQKYRFTRIVVDTGGSMARNNVEEWNRRHSFGMIPAEKRDKYTYIEHMNSEFYLGRIKVASSLKGLKDEWITLVWDDSDEKQFIRHDGTPKEHSGFSNHMADAALYMFRDSMHFRSKAPVPEPVPGTLEFLHKQQLDAKIKALKAAGRKGFRYDRLFN